MSIVREETGVRVEWLILADGAQVAGNKLYLLGGGWDVLTINNGFPAQHNMAVAMAVRVPWHETNQRHAFEIEVATEDGGSLARVGGDFEVGRPAGIKPGQAQRTQIAFNATVRLEEPGGYAVVVRVDGEQQARYSFTVVRGPGAGQRAG